MSLAHVSAHDPDRQPAIEIVGIRLVIHDVDLTAPQAVNLLAAVPFAGGAPQPLVVRLGERY